MSKGYTISYFVNVLSNARTSQVLNADAVYSTVSPRFGYASVKARALDTWLNHKTTAIANGYGRFASFGKTPRARVLKALRLRKQNGFF